jgi:EAL domain-containing protein (putative c-di-GMP-specific phosphodiesterase class I)
VETNSQFGFLLRRHCDEAQGFYFGDPVPADMLADAARSIARKREIESFVEQDTANV